MPHIDICDNGNNIKGKRKYSLYVILVFLKQSIPGDICRQFPVTNWGSQNVYLKYCSIKLRALCLDLYARVCLWLVRAWVRIPFAAIFAEIPQGWFKLMRPDFYFQQNLRYSSTHNLEFYVLACYKRSCIAIATRHSI